MSLEALNPEPTFNKAVSDMLLCLAIDRISDGIVINSLEQVSLLNYSIQFILFSLSEAGFALRPVAMSVTLVLPNSTDRFRGMIVGSMGTTDHHRTWSCKLRLAGDKRDRSSHWEDDAR
ncbi:hypothetical protein TNCV_4434441 [Trichonephila clavipes]|nr:hypothetical protein TNCV_4434441 [Trichonephila clavipes]